MENNMESEQQWCNICCQMVHTMNGGENKCPFCDTEFVGTIENLSGQNDAIDLRSAWVFSLYAPIFLGMMGAFSPSLARLVLQESGRSSSSSTTREDEERENQSENELVVVRRRRTSTYMMNLFRGINVAMVSESENNFEVNDDDDNNNRNTDRSDVVVVDPINEGAMIVRSPNMNHSTPSSTTTSAIRSFIGNSNDFGVGSNFDMLIHHLANMGTSGYVGGSPPARKEAIEAMASVIIEEILQCTICLEDVEIGSEVKEMPCMHKFHSDCIVSWLKLRNSCPVCRFKMPSENTAFANYLEARNAEMQNAELMRQREERIRNGRRHWFPVLQSSNNNFHHYP